MMQNIALNRPASQSSTSVWSTSQDNYIDAGIATNGDIESHQFFHTKEEPYPWWQVDLGSAFFVHKVVLYNRRDIKDRLSRFSLLKSIDGKNWLEVFKKEDVSVFEELSIDLTHTSVARFVRIRLNGFGCLHFRECQVFGIPIDPSNLSRFLEEDELIIKQREGFLDGRCGSIGKVGKFNIFIDDAYGPQVKSALHSGDYESTERRLIEQFLLPTDRVIEIGTAVGVVAMTAASIVGQQNVLTFDANPRISADAQYNFLHNDLGGIVSRVGLLTNRRTFKENTYAEFYVAREFWASRLDAGNKSDIVEAIQIPRFCLEQEIKSFAANVLICDIEGGEVDLLTGADLSEIRLIIVETHYWSRGEKATDNMMRELMMQGFSINLEASGASVSVLRRL